LVLTSKTRVVSQIVASQSRKVVVPIHVSVKWIVVLIGKGTADMFVRN